MENILKCQAGICILAITFDKKNREELRVGNGGKEKNWKKSEKRSKMENKALMTAKKNLKKAGKNLKKCQGKFFWVAIIYTPDARLMSMYKTVDGQVEQPWYKQQKMDLQI